MGWADTFKKRKVFLENFLSLSALQFVSNVLPIITIPFLTRVLGLDAFGIYVFVQAVLTFLDILVSYGFRVSATHQIAKNCEIPEAISSIFWNVIYSKACLFFFIMMVLLISILTVPVLSENSLTILLGVPLLVGNLLFPVWLFQGLQKMKFITILHLFAKSFFVITIFLFVEDASDVGLAIFLQGFGVMLAGLLSLILAFKQFELTFRPPKLGGILFQLRDGRDVFFSQLMVSFYTTANIMILGLFHPGATVAAYALGDKVYRLVGSLSAPFNRAIFPVLSLKYEENRSDYLGIASRSTIGLFLVFSILAILIHSLAPWIIFILVGGDAQNDETIEVLRILAVSIPFFVLAAASTYHLVTQGKSAYLLKILIGAAVANMCFIAPVSFYYEAIGVAWLTLTVATLIAVVQTIAMFTSLKKS